MPEAQFFAVDGNEWIGLAGLESVPDSNVMHNTFTAVERAYRKRNIALALKLLTLDYAKRHGVSHIRTDNDSTNAPMLAINRTLGYKPVPGVYRMTKEPA